MADNLNFVYSSLSQVADYPTQNALRLVMDALATQQQQLQVVASKPAPKVPSFLEIKQQLQSTGSAPLVINGLSGAASPILYGTHASRPSAAGQSAGTAYVETDRLYLYLCETLAGVNQWVYVAGIAYDTQAHLFGDLGAYDVNALYIKTDRNNITYKWSGSAWIYQSGTWQRTQSQLAAMALTASDNGLLVNVTDYAHTLLWTNPALGWAPGDDMSGYVKMWGSINQPGTGWHVMDGSTVNYLNADGSTGSVTLDNLTSNAFGPIYPRFSASYASPADAVAATISGNTADESAHTHDVTIANTIDVTLLVGTNNAAAAQTVTSTAGTAHHHAKGTLANDKTGEPPHVTLVPFFRL